MRLWPLLLALVLAGCNAPPDASDGAPDAGVTPGPGGAPGAGGAQRVAGEGSDMCAEVGSWHDPQVYEALAGADGVQESAPEDLLASAPGDPEARVTYFGVRHADGTTLFLTSNATVVSIAGRLPPDATEESTRARFVAFATRLTPVDDAQAQAWADTFWASRTPGELTHDGQQEVVSAYSAQVRIDAPLLIEDVWQELGPPEVDGRSIRWQEEGAAWEARWERATRTWRVETEERPLVVQAEAQGRVTAFSRESVPEEEAQPWIAKTFAEKGLPLAEFEEWRAGGSTC